jgi:hypothetical protein
VRHARLCARLAAMLVTQIESESPEDVLDFHRAALGDIRPQLMFLKSGPMIARTGSG